MKQQIVLITGANSGIGKAATMKFAAAGCEVIMACRNLEKSKNVQDEIIQKTSNKLIHLMELDMSSMVSIRSFCDTFITQFPKLDILINNAAYFHHGAQYRLSPDNIELTFATNVVGPYLLTMLLASHLKKSDDARVLNASSNIIKHFFDPKKEIDLGDLEGESKNQKKFSVYLAYRNSKMALLMLTFRLAALFKDDGIKVNSLQINGARMSKETLARFKYPWRLIAHIQNLFFPPPEFMANIYFVICTSEKYKDVTGKHFNHKQQVMEPGEENPGFIRGIQQTIGAEKYPHYADRAEVVDHIWEQCRKWTGE
jgi:NAD(P)-dependent dehydrogenase (short-subunit alcohol dehydrogenase family)